MMPLLSPKNSYYLVVEALPSTSETSSGEGESSSSGGGGSAKGSSSKGGAMRLRTGGLTTFWVGGGLVVWVML